MNRSGSHDREFSVRQKRDLDRREGKEGPLFVKVGKYAAIGLEFPSTVIGGMFLGYLLDLYLDTSPWLVAIITFLALVGAFIRLAQWFQRFSGEDK
ncbi:MAG: AtpZ/AtpI family protein [Candidatus Binatia bacterium]